MSNMRLRFACIHSKNTYGYQPPSCHDFRHWENYSENSNQRLRNENLSVSGVLIVKCLIKIRYWMSHINIKYQNACNAFKQNKRDTHTESP